jgi:hypothetical protein
MLHRVALWIVYNASEKSAASIFRGIKVSGTWQYGTNMGRGRMGTGALCEPIGVKRTV